MSVERTLGIIKPDGLKRNLIGQILSRVEKSGLKIIGAKLIHLNKVKAEGFYAVHKEKPFFNSLVKSMTSGPILVFAMQGKGAMSKWREIMGATNPKEAQPGTIRKDFALNIEQNTVHGSDSQQTSQFEVNYFFTKGELHY